MASLDAFFIAVATAAEAPTRRALVGCKCDGARGVAQGVLGSSVVVRLARLHRMPEAGASAQFPHVPGLRSTAMGGHPRTACVLSGRWPTAIIACGTARRQLAACLLVVCSICAIWLMPAAAAFRALTAAQQHHARSRHTPMWTTAPQGRLTNTTGGVYAR